MKTKLKNVSVITLSTLSLLAVCSCGNKDNSKEDNKTDIEITKQFTVTFKDELGNTLESKKYDEGSKPSYTYSKEDTAEWDYTVSGWSLSQDGQPIELTSVTADVTYYAVVSKVKKTYKITFYNENGTEIKSETLEYGAQPTCSYAGPSDTEDYDYTVLGWTINKTGTVYTSIPIVTGEANYYASVTSKKLRYEVKFYDENGNELSSGYVATGTTPSNDYVGPSDTDEWDYTFEGWATSANGDALSTLPAAGADASYYAKVSKVKKQYEISFYDQKGKLIETKKFDYGTTPNYVWTGDDGYYKYYLIGWSSTLGGETLSPLPSVSGNANYYAVTISDQYKFIFDFYDENGKWILHATTDKLSRPRCSYTGPEDTAEWDYTFEGWATTPGGEVINIPAPTENACYYAIVSKKKQQYTINFESNDGTSVDPITNEYGTSIEKPTDPSKDGYKFIGWSTDENGDNKVTWPMTLTGNQSLYANWEKKIDTYSAFYNIIRSFSYNPYEELFPLTNMMTWEGYNTKTTEEAVTYDFNNFVNVSDIKYGGYGEQWKMVLDNIEERKTFLNVVNLGTSCVSASYVYFLNTVYYADHYDTSAHSEDNERYSSFVYYDSDVLYYGVQFKTGIDMPYFGSVTPRVDVSCNVETGDRAVRISINENNAMKYVITENSYVLAYELGLNLISCKSYVQIDRLENQSVQGHVYEFIKTKDKDAVASCADFYMNRQYTSVVGNKASGMPGFNGIINELYQTQGNFICSEVQETFSKWGIEATYHTLWLPLCYIREINNVKAVKKDGTPTFGLGANNNHEIYVNDSDTVFEPAKNSTLGISTSRKYDIEMRKSYFHSAKDNSTGNINIYEVEVPMMFIQAGNYDTFGNDISTKSGIYASVGLTSSYIEKVQEDHENLIPIFEANKESVNSDTIHQYIGVVTD